MIIGVINFVELEIQKQIGYQKHKIKLLVSQNEINNESYEQALQSELITKRGLIELVFQKIRTSSVRMTNQNKSSLKLWMHGCLKLSFFNQNMANFLLMWNEILKCMRIYIETHLIVIHLLINEFNLTQINSKMGFKLLLNRNQQQQFYYNHSLFQYHQSNDYN
ncbi:unnamed protein product [Paramecium octaurelia]|uniref:Uncharacterized protein n=1 Tax=Paramecium octaurelia TaxID=43137 RepID=A0A8S1YDR6_PAROT|nr:unnamed protein product [Paramecium octaurelia]